MSIDTQPTPETLAAFWLNATFAATDDPDADEEHADAGLTHARARDLDDACGRILTAAARALLAGAAGADATALTAILTPVCHDLDAPTPRELDVFYTSERLIRSALAD